MTGRPGYLVLLAFGAALLRVATSARLLAYTRAVNRPVVLAAALAIVLAAGARWLAPRARTPAPRLGYLLAVPVLVLVCVTPPRDGALPGRRRQAAPSRAVPTLRGPDPIALSLSGLVQRAVWDPASLAGHRLRVLGFAAGRRNGSLVLARLSIVCCAADAQEDDVEVSGAGPVAAGRWVAVTGRFGGTSPRERFVPRLVEASLTPVPAPADPYD